MSNNKRGKLYLSGGGEINQTFELDDRFLRDLSIRKICYIPLAGTPGVFGYESYFDWFIKMLAAHQDEFFEVDMVTASDQLNELDLHSYGAVYIGGGNSYRLLNLFKSTDFALKILEYFNHGGMIYGGSAGAIVLGKSLEIVKQEDLFNAQYGDAGLGLLGDYSILCHFSEKNESVAGSFMEQGNRLISLTESSGIIFDGTKKQFTCVGTSPVVIYDKGRKIIPLGGGGNI